MSRAKCLRCGDQPLIRAGCDACGGTGRRAAAPKKRVAQLAAALAAPAPLAPPWAPPPPSPAWSAASVLPLPLPPLAFDSALDALQRVWGYPAFRPGQQAIVDAVLAGEDLFVIAPTSFGKSVCFQLPAVMRPDRPVLVVSPLIALMQDQVQQARGRGIRALSLTSHLSREEMRDALAQMPASQIVYAAPERLDNLEFQQRLAVNPPWLVALDEAHSIGGEAEIGRAHV